MAKTGVVVLDKEIKIKGPSEKPISIFGFTFDKDVWNRDDLLTYSINNYLAYLMGCERVEMKGGILEDPEVWCVETGLMVVLNPSTKNYIYKKMKPELIGYRIVEYTDEIEIRDGECVDLLITSRNPLIRLGLVKGKQETLDKSKVSAQTLLQKLCTLHQYCNMGDEYDGTIVDIWSHQLYKPVELNVSEKEKRVLKGMLLLEDFNNVPDNKENTRYVKTYDEFLKEEIQ